MTRHACVNVTARWVTHDPGVERRSSGRPHASFAGPLEGPPARARHTSSFLEAEGSHCRPGVGSLSPTRQTLATEPKGQADDA